MRNWLVVGLAVVVWAAGTGAAWFLLPPRPLAEWSLPADCHPIAFLPGTHTLVTVYKSGQQDRGPFELWDLDNGTKTGSYPGPDGPFYASTGSFDAEGLAQPSQTLRVHLSDGQQSHGCLLLDAATGREITRSPEVNLQPVPPGRTYVVSRKEPVGERADLFDVADGRQLGSFPGVVRGSAADGKYLLTTPDWQNSQSLTVWTTDTGRAVGAIELPHDRALWHSRLSADGRTLLTAPGQVWDVPTGTLRYAIDEGTAVLSPDGNGLLVGRRDGGRLRFRRHDLLTGQPDPGRGWSVRYKSQRTQFAAGPGRRLYVYGQVGEYPHGDSGWWLLPTPDGAMNRFQVLDPETGRLLLVADGWRLVGRTDDGERLVYCTESGSMSGSLTVWAIPPARPVERLLGVSLGWGIVVGLVAWRLGRLARRLGGPALVGETRPAPGAASAEGQG